MNNKSKLLVFPCNLPEAEEYAQSAILMGMEVVRASSNPEGLSYKSAYLPYISQDSFDSEFKSLLLKENISHIYAPHDVVLNYLEKLKEKNKTEFHFQLCNDYIHKQLYKKFDAAYNWAENCIDDVFRNIELTAPALRKNQYANLIINYNNVPGQSDESKLKVLCYLFRNIPCGDIVEVGTLWGRSAYAMAWLATKHNIGNVICVDPWAYIYVGDQGEQAKLVNDMADTINYDKIFEGFLVSAAELDNINYIREPSVIAGETYAGCTSVGKLITPEFGETSINGKISILHVDGNHKYEDVKNDIETWMPYVQQGGWILLDDYDWAFGDGPKRVGDELIHHPRVTSHFLISDTLYIKL
ncbi:class I SAM-dependent methyltransferase [Prodigiosinella aquatilis]|nr:class I SAM-dependent methyltransferase [Prodigiosinella sp. LS101]WJV52149.1 class I SAM-dependent methyltransferase [Prodigiosinella sp. LS101]WJV56507.1 class I SAM-dependent methyltransferase [Pectobacteriaceae bacterium C111]